MEVLFLLLALGFPFVLGYAGYSEAGRKNRNKAVWGVVCGIGGILPLIAIYLLRSKEPSRQSNQESLPLLAEIKDEINDVSYPTQKKVDSANKIKMVESRIIGFINDNDAKSIHNTISVFKSISHPTIEQEKEMSSYLNSVILKYKDLL
jgi:hypothetical protein